MHDRNYQARFATGQVKGRNLETALLEMCDARRIRLETGLAACGGRFEMSPFT